MFYSNDNSNISFASVDLDTIDDDNVGGNTLDTDNFFDRLEKEVNGAVYDDAVATEGNTKEAQPVDTVKSEVQTEPSKVEGEDQDYDKLNKRYQDSSREAKRLAKELRETKAYSEQYAPLIDAMRQDPELVHQVINYLEAGGSNKSIADTMNLPENFVFDMDEAISDPNSDSAKVLDRLVDAKVSKKVNVRAEETNKQIQLSEQKAALMKEFDLKDDDVQDLLDWASDKQLTMRDLYILKNGSSRDRKIARSIIEDVKTQSEKVSQSGPSLASKGSGAPKDKSPDQELFDQIAVHVAGGEIF